MSLFLSVVFFSLVQAESFKQKTVVFNNGVSLKVEMALTPGQKSQGLMGRTHLAEGSGMLFEFQPPQILSFWMKNTLIPLSIGFFREDKTLIEIQDMEPSHGPVREELLPRYVSSSAAMYAIEVPKGWFHKKKIKPGSQFRFK